MVKVIRRPLLVRAVSTAAAAGVAVWLGSNPTIEPQERKDEMRRESSLFVAGVLVASLIGYAFALDPKTGPVNSPKQLQTVKPPTGPIPPKGGVVAVPAKVSLECGGRTFTLATGNDKGDCQVTFAGDGKTQTGASCSDGKGNTASATCAKGGCTSSSGSGSCTAGK